MSCLPVYIMSALVYLIIGQVYAIIEKHVPMIYNEYQHETTKHTHNTKKHRYLLLHILLLRDTFLSFILGVLACHLRDSPLHILNARLSCVTGYYGQR